MLDDFDQEVELQELRDALVRQQRATRKAHAKSEAIVEAVYQAAKDAAVTLGRAPSVPKPKTDPRRKNPEVALIHATDWQLGKQTSDYDIDTCRKRIHRFAEKIGTMTEIQRADHPVKEAHVMFGGDMVEGLGIFPGQPYEVEAHLFEQLFATAGLMEDFVRRMLAIFERVTVTCEYGNHGRLGRKGDMPGADNIDRVAYKIAGDRLEDERVTWHTDSNWYQIVTIGNYSALLVHGDEIKSFGGNTPAFGLIRKCNAWSTGVIPEPFDDVYVGHFHTPMTLTMANGHQIYVTGSPESENVYAKEFMAATGHPSQRLHYVDPEAGRVTASYLVWLD